MQDMSIRILLHIEVVSTWGCNHCIILLLSAPFFLSSVCDKYSSFYVSIHFNCLLVQDLELCKIVLNADNWIEGAGHCLFGKKLLLTYGYAFVASEISALLQFDILTYANI
ncbi:hypothetical protein Ancab_028798 [Ancistrocladus abbreviatus]